MATEKYFVFSESGELKRMKGRIVRFLDNEDPSGADKSAIRTSLEVSPDAAGLVQADVGTAPNEIPVNGMLGDMAYQSSDGVSAAKLEVESTTGTATTQALTVTDGSDTKFVVQEDGRVGIGNASPGAGYSGAADDLVVGDGVGDRGLTIVSGTTGNSYILFADGTGYGGYRGRVQYNHNADQLYLGASANTNWKIDGATGNFVRVTAGAGIDFGSGDTLSDYEQGGFTPTIYYQNSSGLTISYTTQTGAYIRVGDLVSVHAFLVWTVTGTPANDNIGVSLPFAPVSTRQYLQCTDSQGQSAVAECSALPQVAIANSSSLVGNLADNIGAGTHTIIISGTYRTS